MPDSLPEQLVTANRIVANEDIIQGFGHVSVRRPETDTMLISRSLSPAFVTAEDVLEMTLDGEVIDDDRRPYAENVIHRAIYRARPDVRAVIHHHAPPIMPFTITDVEYRTAYHQGMLFADGVPKFDDYDEEGGLLVVTEAEADRMAAVLGDRRAQLLEGHGANTTGSSLKEAVVATYYFVKNAEFLLAGLDLGSITFDPSPEIARATVDSAILSDIAVDRLWGYLTRRLGDR